MRGPVKELLRVFRIQEDFGGAGRYRSLGARTDPSLVLRWLSFAVIGHVRYRRALVLDNGLR